MFDSDAFLKRLNRLARLSLPHILTVALMIFTIVTLPIPYADYIKPYLVLMPIYYWSIYRPTLVPPVLCFGIGLTIDILSWAPLGLNAIVLLAVRWLVADQRRFLMGQPYTSIWAAFALVTLTAALLQWVLFGLVHLDWSPLLPVGMSILVSMFLFPFVSLLLIGVHHMLPDEAAVRTRRRRR